MKTPLRLIPAALSDLETAADWYGSRSTALRAGFLNDLDQAVERILIFPESAPIYRGTIRRTLMSKYPYGIFYVVDVSGVKIIAVFHYKQRQSLFLSR